MTKKVFYIFGLLTSIMFMLIACNRGNSGSSGNTQKSSLYGVIGELKGGKVIISFQKGALETVYPVNVDSTYEVLGLQGIPKGIYIGDYGGDPNPVLCILLEDGSVQTLIILNALINKNFTAAEKQPGLIGIVSFQTELIETDNYTSNDIYAIDRDGKKYSININIGEELSEEEKQQIEVDNAVHEKAIEILKLIKAGNYTELAKYIHPVKGVRFFPYINEFESGDTKTANQRISLSSKDLATLPEKNNTFVWGQYAGSGEDIRLTIKDYFRKFVYERDYLNGTHPQTGMVSYQPDEQFSRRHVTFGFEPSSAEALDWSTLNLFFEKYNEIWYLTVIAHDCWTP